MGNSTSRKWGVIYSSHADTRTWVPKKITKMWWALNLAKPAGAAWLTGLFILILLFSVAVVLFAINFLSKLKNVG